MTLDIMNQTQGTRMMQKRDPESDPKIATHTSDGKKRKVTDTRNGDSQKIVLSNRTLPIITTAMNPQIDDRFATCGLSPHNIVTPLTTEAITGATRRSARVLWTLKHVSWTVRDSTPPQVTATFL